MIYLIISILFLRVVDVGCEWRSFQDANGVDNSRVGDKENPLLNDANLSTMILQNKNGDPSMAYKTKSLVSHEDKVKLMAFRQISQISDRLNLPKMIVDRACFLFAQTYSAKAMKGKKLETIVAGAVYIACRCEGVPRTLKELCAVSGVPKVEIGRVFKKIKDSIDSGVSSVSPDSYIVILEIESELVLLKLSAFIS